MTTYLWKTLWSKAVTLFMVSIISFFVIKLAPGEPSQINPLNPRFTKADLERFRKAFDLDKPLVVQYGLFYKRFFSGTLTSFKDNQPVIGKIWERFLNSLPLFILGTLLSWTLAFPTGIFSAIKRGTLFDRTATVLAYALLSIPSFVIAYYLIRLLGPTFHLPLLGLKTVGAEEATGFVRFQDRIWHMVIPALLIAIMEIAFLSRYVRDQMLDVMQSDFVRTARAKGCEESVVYYHHALRNALLPFVTLFGFLIPGLIGSSVIIETIFAWPGMGRLGYEAILTRDYPIVLSLNFITAVLVLTGTFVSDVLYALVDPRIKLSESA